MDSLKVVKGFAGTEVQIVKSGRIVKVDLENATKEQLKLLHELNHPAVEVEKPKPKTQAKQNK